MRRQFELTITTTTTITVISDSPINFLSSIHGYLSLCLSLLTILLLHLFLLRALFLLFFLVDLKVKVTQFALEFNDSILYSLNIFAV